MGQQAGIGGSCLCGSVGFALRGPLRDVVICHCHWCRKSSGHVFASAAIAEQGLDLHRPGALAWYRSSPGVRRGFCAGCGSSLFWLEAEGQVRFAPGALDAPALLRIRGQIFEESAGDYYTPSGRAPRVGTAPARLDCSCLCGETGFSVPGPAGEITACHCSGCRKSSGHFGASFAVDEAAVDWHGRATVAEFVLAGSGHEAATRGFCRICGSSLYHRDPDGSFQVEAGAVDGRTGGRLAQHLCVAQKGSYYELTDDLPQNEGRA